MNEIQVNENKITKINTDDFVGSLIREVGIMKTCEVLQNNTMLPPQYRQPANLVIALEMSSRTGMPLLSIVNNLNVIGGKISWSATAIISMVKTYYAKKGLEVSPKFVGQPNTDDWGCYVTVVDSEGKEVERGSIVTIKLAKGEGWFKKAGSKWLTMPEQMLKYRAFAFFARVAIPDLLMGFNHTTDEIEDISDTVQEALNPFEREENNEND